MCVRIWREENIMLDLYQRVAVNRDIPEANLKAGEVGWLIDDVLYSQSV